MPRLKSPKQKGDAYERELASYMATHLEPILTGIPRRALLSGGGVSDGGYDLENVRIDVARHGHPSSQQYELGVEAKRTETFAPYKAMAQAETARANLAKRGFKTHNIVPLVVNRKNNMATGDSLVCLRLKDLVHLLVGAPPPSQSIVE
jgi:hypothetical protein